MYLVHRKRDDLMIAACQQCLVYGVLVYADLFSFAAVCAVTFFFTLLGVL